MKFDKYADIYDLGFMGKGSRRFYTNLLKEIDIHDDDSVLDVGCGTGTILNCIGKEKTIKGYGIDVSENMIQVAKEKNVKYEFCIGDSSKLPYEDESMDVVMACMAYHHFSNQEGFRKEVLRVLKPGGILYISDPRFPLVVRAFLNTFFKDAGFRSTKRNVEEFEKSGFKSIGIRKDLYVQVLKLQK